MLARSRLVLSRDITEIKHFEGNPALRRHVEALPMAEYTSCMIFAPHNFERDTMQSVRATPNRPSPPSSSSVWSSSLPPPLFVVIVVDVVVVVLVVIILVASFRDGAGLASPVLLAHSCARASRCCCCQPHDGDGDREHDGAVQDCNVLASMLLLRDLQNQSMRFAL